MKKFLMAGIGLTTSSNIISYKLKRKEVFMPEIGVCTSIKNAAMLASLGYAYIEETVRDFLVPDKEEALFTRNLALAAEAPISPKVCNSFLPGNLKSVGPQAVHSRILEFARIAFQRAQKAGIEFIAFGSGDSRNIPENYSFEEATKQFVSLLSQMAPIAGEYKVTIVLEPLRSGETNLINTLAEGAEIVRKVNHPNCKLLADIYHMLKEGEGPESIIENGDLLDHVHIAEEKGRSIPGTHGEDFTPFFEALKQINYQGRISIEGYWKDMEAQAPVAIKTLKKQIL